jgi:hypothetical protein
MKRTKQKPVKNVRWDLQFFIRFLTKTGEGSLNAKFDLPEREALQRAVERLGASTDSLIGVIERSGIPNEAREVALHNLWSCLGSAYTIGSQGTLSANSKVVAKKQQVSRAQQGAKKRHQEDQVNKIINAEIYRHRRRGGENRMYKSAESIARDAYPVLEDHWSKNPKSKKITEKAVRERVARRLKQPAL